MSRWLTGAACAALAWAAEPVHAQTDFPFGSELIMDADRMPGSRRIPNMEVDDRGGLDLEMWCNRMQGRFVVAGPTLSVLTGPVTERACPPAQMRADEALLAALAGVTGWRRDGAMLTLTGAATLRFRVPTN